MSLTQAIDKYIQENYVRLHSPAHAGKLNLRDLTEVEGLDDLQKPSGLLKDAQELAAKLFNAQKSFFSVGGASLANQAACLALGLYLNSKAITKPVLVARNVHKSIIAGIIIAGFDIEYIEPEWDENIGVYTRVTIHADELNDKYAALIITNPSYEGFYSVIPKLDIPVIVDEAHGAHCSFSETLPAPALQYGADLVVHSWHKSLGTLTQTGALHVGRASKISVEFAEKSLGLLQSTSPSYLLLESICIVLEKFAKEGKALITKTLENTNAVDFKYLYPNDDSSRLILRIGSETGFITGKLLEEKLLKYKVSPEAILNNAVLACVNSGNNFSDVKKLNEVLKLIEKEKLEFNNTEKAKPIPDELLIGNLREKFLNNNLEVYAPCPPGILV